ncbi:hypothetical protein HELRODRAFT_103762 [Helobdella robusta]|uniref:CH-like domain-containing protein n=1 Tax=Helobdella robusta TaxID=6412 RepID=T1EDH3_HELRO|nr:hypothetical protein HELRODRAFT_103762 [Helobdella robusta]ESN92404.1 hypothetical protein HELRODRAFT_103762 [Helobdella robusta]
MSELMPRDVLKWVHSLDLTRNITNPQWDLSSGFIIGQMLYRYFPNVVPLYRFHDGSKLEYRLFNWTLIKQILNKVGISVPTLMLDATAHCKFGAARMTLIKLYEQLNGRSVPGQPDNLSDPNFTDRRYQLKIPPLARSTTVMTLRTNFKDTERKVMPDIECQRLKARNIIESHVSLLAEEKRKNIWRYRSKPNLLDSAVRKTPPPGLYTDYSFDQTLGKY